MDVIPYLQSHGAQGADDAGAANIIARLFGDKDGKSAATIENLIGMFRNLGRVLTDVVFPVLRDFARGGTPSAGPWRWLRPYSRTCSGSSPTTRTCSRPPPSGILGMVG
jgi:hypothetical protein